MWKCRRARALQLLRRLQYRLSGWVHEGVYFPLSRRLILAGRKCHEDNICGVCALLSERQFQPAMGLPDVWHASYAWDKRLGTCFSEGVR